MLSSVYRGRRLRQSPGMRAFCRETAPLLRSQLIQPYFVVESEDRNFSKEISAMPGQYQLGLFALRERVARAVDKGLCALMLFGIPAQKDDLASGAYARNGIVQEALRLLKRDFPQLLLIADDCLCEYMAHGHCGILQSDGIVANDSSVELLVRTAVSQAEAGADIIAPSDMMDGRVVAIRQGLDEAGFANVPIMSYAFKYASAYYGPFREAAESAPACGDRKTYQMDPGNWREALREAKADVAEGADLLIVKPAGPYGDIIRLMRDNLLVPLVAYQVSGEYSLIKAAGQLGWINEDDIILESLLGLKRAGADRIITYFTEYLLENDLAF